MPESLAVTFCRVVDLWPGVAETYENFMDGALSKYDSLTEVQYNKVPKEVRDWADGAIEAKLNGNPFDECPGFEEVFDVEDKAPMFNEADAEEEEAPKKGKKARVSRGTKKNAKAANGPRGARPLGDGKTSRIMDAIYANPKISVEQIRAELEKDGIATQKTSTTVVRSFYRHSIKHLAAKGALKHNIDF